MSNAVVEHTDHEAYLFCEGALSERLESSIDPRVQVHKQSLIGSQYAPEVLYELDCVLAVNTDSKFFCRLDYWQGRSGRHEVEVDLSRIRQMVFLFNFIVSPARHLWEIEAVCPRLKIVTANRKFFTEIGEQERYRRVRHIPRTILESPIDPKLIQTTKSPSAAIRIGMHSTSNGDKWNERWPDLIRAVNEHCGPTHVKWQFMGMPGKMRAEMAQFPNVEAFPEHTRAVPEFLRDLDIFAFFTSWKREEPWSRSVAEALMSGCPVIATPKGGNPDQIVSGNNGLLCRTFEDFVEALITLVDDSSLRMSMARIARVRSGDFTSESVVRKFIQFIEQ